MKDKLRAEKLYRAANRLKREKFICPGPNRLAFMVDGLFAGEGHITTWLDCLKFADCSCWEYDRRTNKIERLMDKARGIALRPQFPPVQKRHHWNTLVRGNQHGHSI